MIYGLVLQVAKARTWLHVVGNNLYMLRVSFEVDSSFFLLPNEPRSGVLLQSCS